MSPPADNLVGPTELFTLDFSVSAGAETTPTTFTIKLPAFNTVIGFVGPAGTDTDTFEVNLSCDSSGVHFTPVPEPSEWILALLMTGLLGTVASKKLFGKNNKAVETENA